MSTELCAPECSSRADVLHAIMPNGRSERPGDLGELCIRELYVLQLPECERFARDTGGVGGRADGREA